MLSMWLWDALFKVIGVILEVAARAVAEILGGDNE